MPTLYFIALLSVRDDDHERALKIARTLRRPFVTTKWALTEMADGFAETPARPVVAPFFRRLARDPNCTIIPATDMLFDRGMEMFEQHRDKG